MKYHYSFFLFFLVVASGLKAQSFSLEDSVFQNGQTHIVRNLYFDYDKCNIRNDASIILDSLAEFLKKNQNVKMEIGVHTDTRGSEMYSRRLSQKRAESIVNYLVERGINKQRLTPKGYEGSNPLIPDVEIKKMALEEQEKAHFVNRRVECKIIDTNF
ncbi:OmpA family protein [Cytophagaceae bacterium ABcell3]|nr:OmpA family protein [Cytophagaceae bacterium ABcell3]